MQGLQGYAVLLSAFLAISANSHVCDPETTSTVSIVPTTPLPPDPTNTVTVSTNGSGTVTGGITQTFTGKAYSFFYGIRYAVAARFSLAQLANMTGETSALEFGSSCVQMDNEGNVVGSEDCLFINVYSTRTTFTDNQAPLPVLFFIHGGDFLYGSGSLYNPEYFMEYYDCVVVTINYRLGALGWLRVGSTEATGSLGLMDQVAALQWVQTYIGYFGGDASHVLLFGEGSGAACVHAHYLSSSTTGLFSAAFLQSGTLFSSWAIASSWESTTTAVLSMTNCANSDEQQALTCLRGVELSAFYSASYSASSVALGVLTTGLLPYGVNSNYFSDTLENIIANGMFQHVPIAITVTNAEILYYLAQVSASVTLTDATSFIVNMTNAILEISSQTTIVSQSLLQYYFGTTEITTLDISVLVSGFVQFVSDKLFVYPATHTMQLMANMTSVQSYYGVFSYEGYFSLVSGFVSWLRGISGVPQTGDLYYQFVMTQINHITLPTLDLTFIQTFTSFFYNMAASGNPTPTPIGGFSWTSFSLENMAYAIINASWQIANLSASFAMQLWRMAQYFASCSCPA